MSKKWRKREKEVMEYLGLSPTPGSGNGFLRKEDGDNDEIIAQLKSTETKAISLRREDVKDLFYHGAISGKIPVFVLDLCGGKDDFLLIAMRPDDIKDVAKYLEVGD